MQRGIKLGDGLLEFHFIGFHTGQPIGCGEQYIVVYIGSSKLPGLATVKRSHTSTCCIPWCLQVKGARCSPLRPVHNSKYSACLSCGWIGYSLYEVYWISSRLIWDVLAICSFPEAFGTKIVGPETLIE